MQYCTNSNDAAVSKLIMSTRIVQEIGAKQRIMELMTHEDQDVRYQALSAVQKYMTNAWEF
jgi:hypothetical protein